ncbi:MAG TPA: FtsQ-type POTRA domain-containing protein [Vicinamibacterales bacterium]|nr:FtsQ-type POTRA domain-containing protein [Vicinamibacterales bacterium]
MSPVAAVAADKRFRRAHVKPSSRRHAGARALVKPAVRWVLPAVVVIYAMYRGAGVVTHARVLQVDRIEVTGNERLSKGEVIAVLGGLRGESLMWTDLDAWRSRLLASPWVRDAALRRSLPSTVEVAVLERTPIGIARLRSSGGGLYLVDDRGVIIDQYGPQYADLDLPIVDGLDTLRRPPGAGGSAPANGSTDPYRAELAARVIAALRAKPRAAARLSQVDVSDLHNAAVILNGDPAVIHLGDDQFLPRLESYLGLASALRERVPDIESVDLRFDDRIYVKPAYVPHQQAAVRRGKSAQGKEPAAVSRSAQGKKK